MGATATPSNVAYRPAPPPLAVTPTVASRVGSATAAELVTAAATVAGVADVTTRSLPVRSTAPAVAVDSDPTTSTARSAADTGGSTTTDPPADTASVARWRAFTPVPAAAAVRYSCPASLTVRFAVADAGSPASVNVPVTTFSVSAPAPPANVSGADG